MNKIITFIFIVIIIIILFLSLFDAKNMKVVQTGNLSYKPIDMVVGKYQDSDCGMTIDDLVYASQVISPDGKTWFFHDHGGMAHWINNKVFKDSAIIWAMSKDTKKWINARKAWYSRDDITPMGYGFGAYEKKKDGFIDFKTMQLLMLRGETLKNPLIYKKFFRNQSGYN